MLDDPFVSDDKKLEIDYLTNNLCGLSSKFYLGKTVLASEYILSLDVDKEDYDKNMEKISQDLGLGKITDVEARKQADELDQSLRHKIYVTRSKDMKRQESLITYHEDRRIEITYPEQTDENSNVPLRTRLLIAHELGHIFLHWRNGRDLTEENTCEEKKILEIEANLFAKYLIFKKNYYYKDWCENIGKKENWFFEENEIDSEIKNLWPNI